MAAEDRRRSDAPLQRCAPVGVHLATLPPWLGVPVGVGGREGGRLRAVRVLRCAASRGRPGAVASRWAGSG